ncbi:MAG: response regulator [Spirochaetes bacterium]|nr:response regulator [Spirochaetota bacterium]
MANLKILIVDDIMIMRKALKDILLAQDKANPHLVVEAANGTDALFMYKEVKPDVVFLDIVMPDYNGKALVKEFMEIDSEARIIMCTGSSDRASIIECVRSGAKDYVVKPPNAGRVYKALEKVMSGGKLTGDEAAAEIADEAAAAAAADAEADADAAAEAD